MFVSGGRLVIFARHTDKTRKMQ